MIIPHVEAEKPSKPIENQGNSTQACFRGSPERLLRNIRRQRPYEDLASHHGCGRRSRDAPRHGGCAMRSPCNSTSEMLSSSWELRRRSYGGDISLKGPIMVHV